MGTPIAEATATEHPRRGCVASKNPTDSAFQLLSEVGSVAARRDEVSRAAQHTNGNLDDALVEDIPDVDNLHVRNIDVEVVCDILDVDVNRSINDGNGDVANFDVIENVEIAYVHEPTADLNVQVPDILCGSGPAERREPGRRDSGGRRPLDERSSRFVVYLIVVVHISHSLLVASSNGVEGRDLFRNTEACQEPS